MTKTLSLLIVMLLSLLLLCGCQNNDNNTNTSIPNLIESDVSNEDSGFSGTFVGLGGSWDFVFHNDDENSGTFEIYEEGKKVGRENIRYINTWSLEDNILSLIRDESTSYYYMVFDGFLIELDDKDSEPDYTNYIAPEGDRFDYHIGHYWFESNGSVSDEYVGGSYYREDNIIYCNLYSEEYYPIYYIYNDNYIVDSGDVLLESESIR